MNQESDILVLHPLVVVYRNAIATPEQQLELVSLSKSVCKLHQSYHYGFDKLASLTIDSQDDADIEHVFDKLQEVARDIWKTAIVDSGAVTNKDDMWTQQGPISDAYTVGLIEVLGYEEDSFLKPHVDHVQGVNIIISFGATTHFYWHTSADEPPHPITLTSGDAIIFPSHGKAEVWHGITHFDGNSVPDWFDWDPYARTCLQFRQKIVKDLSDAPN